MKKYVKHISIFILPLFLLAFIPSLVLFKAKEAHHNIDNFIDIHHKEAFILGYAYNGKGTNYEYYKFKEANNKQADILVLGSSRALQFRDYMFKQSFYNAGFTVGVIEDYVTFLNALPEQYSSKLLIIVLDQWMFNPNYTKSIEPKPLSIYLTNNSLNFSNAYLNYFDVYKALFTQKIILEDLFGKQDTTYVGLNALINHKGFRSDGSFDYGINHKYYDDFESVNMFFEREISWINNNEKYFMYGEQLDENAVKNYKDLLKLCKDKSIKVFSVLPPLPETVNNMLSKKKSYTYLDKIYKTLKPLSQQYDMEFYDFTNRQETSLDTDFIDGHHGKEISYAMMLTIISKENTKSKLNEYIDLRRINATIANYKN